MHSEVKGSCRALRSLLHHPVFVRLGLASLHLAAQGLLTPPARPAGREDVLACVRRLALLQLDTIHAVARSHHLVLHARLGDYSLTWLDELLVEAAGAGGAARRARGRDLPRFHFHDEQGERLRTLPAGPAGAGDGAGALTAAGASTPRA